MCDWMYYNMISVQLEPGILMKESHTFNWVEQVVYTYLPRLQDQPLSGMLAGVQKWGMIPVSVASFYGMFS